MSDVREAPGGPSESGEPEPEREKGGRREPGTLRKGRCATHPGEDSVAVCDVCGRALCIVCAVPVRGSVVGQECLAEVLEDPPEAPMFTARPSPARVLVAAGLALTLAASILPWARYGDASGMFQAWTMHWSLVAVVAAAAGLLALGLRRRLPGDQRVQAVALVAAGALALLGVAMHGVHPPPLSERAPLGWGVAMLGSSLALVGALAYLKRAVRSAD
jgi:hypothetical protein